MPRVDFSHQLASDFRSSHLQISVDGKPKVGVVLTATEMEGLIQNLAGQRANMLDVPPPDLVPGRQMPAIIDPVIGSSEERFDGKRLLAIRHPGMGWLGFFIPDETAKEVADWMTRPLL
jgi:hypothetical protein